MSDEKQQRPTKRVADPEIQALAKIDATITEALEGLSEAAQNRVMLWVRDRYFSEPERVGLLSAAELIAMGKTPSVMSAVNREGGGRSA